MKILVTGGAGFIGSHVVDALIGEGHTVGVVDDLSTGVRSNVNARATFFQMDVRDENIRSVFRAERFDAVIHQAAQMDVRRSVDDPVFDASVNITGSLNLLENCRLHGVGRFLFASTGGAIYGEQERFPADESHPARPISPYGVAKLAVEKYLFYYGEIHGLRSVSLRYSNVYGPRQNPLGEAGVVAIFARKMLDGGRPVINGDGDQTRDYVYVGDVVRANILALGCNTSAVFNVGTGIETTVNQLFAAMNALTGGRCPEGHGPAKKGEQRRSSIDSHLLGKTFGWSPSVPLDEGLRRTVEYFRRRG